MDYTSLKQGFEDEDPFISELFQMIEDNEELLLRKEELAKQPKPKLTDPSAMFGK